MRICILHKYYLTERGNEICIKCGKIKFPLWMSWAMFRLRFSCWLWKIRGLQTCPHHGFCSQSWITGYCNQCNRSNWTKKEIKKAEEELRGAMY